MSDVTETTSLIQRPNQPLLIFSVRFTLVFLIFLCAAIQCMQKIDTGIAIVCMVNSTNSYIPVDLNQTSNCLFQLNNKTQFTKGEFNWSKKEQGLIMSSYFYGYILTQIAGGWLSLKIGGKNVLCIAMLFGSILTMCVPFTARFNYTLLIISRFLNGIAHGMVWSAINDIFIRWIPQAEKSRLIGFASAGSKIGNIIALPLGGYLCLHGFDNGWPSIFYIYGMIGVLWCLLFFTLTTNDPKTHKFISEFEKNYISGESLEVKSKDTNIQNNIRRKPTPWLKILTSKPCIGIYFAQFAANWGNYLFLTSLPTFMQEILKFDIQSNGLFSALPYVTGWCCAIFSSQISDILIRSELVSCKNVRKMFTGFALFVPMIATLVLAYVDCSQPYLAVALLMIGVGFLGLATGGGYIININEVGGIYSGVLFGISNTFGSIPGSLAPYLVSLLTMNKLQSEWRIVFFITSGIYFVGGLIFMILCDDKTPEWAKKQEVEESND